MIRTRKHAILPEDREEPTIDSMMTGEEFYTVPWAMWVDSERRCWLHPKYTTHARRGGTVQMLVKKRRDGYYVRLTDRRYSPQETPGYASPADTEYIPVAGFL